MTDDPATILRFAIKAFREGGAALATLVEIRGGAARAIGSHIAVAADGRFCGYVSGGCVEAAVASEALQALAEGKDRLVRYGNGSPYFDIVLPCGGGIAIAIHILRDSQPLEQILRTLELRQVAGLSYLPSQQMLAVHDTVQRAAWLGGEFVTLYRPCTRVAISGQSAEAQAIKRLALACEYEVFDLGLTEASQAKAASVDRFTAVVLLHHDLDAEESLLEAALRSRAFYIGALGSTRTHRRRTERLRKLGFDRGEIERIKAPIGLFGPTRDATSLGLSVLSDIAATRLAAYA
jgi:xanthine dehydrogenase accessory factor